MKFYFVTNSFEYYSKMFSQFPSTLFVQDKADDILIGVKSTALLFKDKTVPWLGLVSTSMVFMLLTSGYMADQTWPYYAAVGGVAGHLAWQVCSILLYCE